MHLELRNILKPYIRVQVAGDMYQFQGTCFGKVYPGQISLHVMEVFKKICYFLLSQHKWQVGADFLCGGQQPRTWTRKTHAVPCQVDVGFLPDSQLGGAIFFRFFRFDFFFQIFFCIFFWYFKYKLKKGGGF